MKADLVVADCRVVKPDAVVHCTLAIQDGVVAAAVAPGEVVSARREIDAGGRYVLPGLVDTHVHLGIAPRSFVADCATESRHAVTGGVTTVLPFVNHRGSYREVLPEFRRAVVQQSLVDMVFHVIVAGDEQIAEVPAVAAEFGIRSFKCFMAYKGREATGGLQGMSDGEIFALFRQLAQVPGGTAIVHCENMEVIERHQAPFMTAGRQDTRAWSESRPVFGELEAIRRMIAFAAEAGIHLLVPHMGVGIGSEFLRRKQWGAARVSTETCPHYLVLDMETDRGAAGKVNPPLRGRDHVEALWGRLADGTVDVIGSDLVPFTRDIKGTDLWTARAGIPGGTAMILPVLLGEGVRRRGLPIQKVVELTSYRAARLFGLYPRKGALEVGSDADLVIVDLDREVPVDARRLNSVSDYTPYEGYTARGWADVTIAGGQVVYEAGQVVADGPRGRVLRAGEQAA